MTSQVKQTECYREVRASEGDKGNPMLHGKTQDRTHRIATYIHGSETPVDMRSQAELRKEILTHFPGMSFAKYPISRALILNTTVDRPRAAQRTSDFFRFVSSRVEKFSPPGRTVREIVTVWHGSTRG